MSRPTIYTQELVERAWAYANGGWSLVGDKVPSVAGLACEIGIRRETCHAWAKDENNQFSNILMVIAEKQERELLNNGLDGTFNPPITKMMLSKHGYSDKIDQSHTSPDGSMSPQKPVDLSNAPPEVLDWIMAQNIDDDSNP